jgi:Cysteine rich repeat
MLKLLPTFALLLAVTGAPQAAHAAEDVGNRAMLLREAWKDCAADRKALCSGVAIGGGRIVNCLIENADKVSPVCRKHVDAVKSASRAWESCEADIKTFCQGVTQGSGRILACLNGNQDRISKPCLTGLKQAEEALK